MNSPRKALEFDLMMDGLRYQMAMHNRGPGGPARQQFKNVLMHSKKGPNSVTEGSGNHEEGAKIRPGARERTQICRRQSWRLNLKKEFADERRRIRRGQQDS